MGNGHQARRMIVILQHLRRMEVRWASQFRERIAEASEEAQCLNTPKRRASAHNNKSPFSIVNLTCCEVYLKGNRHAQYALVYSADFRQLLIRR